MRAGQGPQQQTADAASDADWDLMFAAITERLRDHAGQPGCGDATLVLDCVHALESLHRLHQDQRERAARRTHAAGVHDPHVAERPVQAGPHPARGSEDGVVRTG